MNVVQRLFQWIVFLALTAVSIAAAELETREVRLCTLSDETIASSFVISPDCKRTAFANQDDSGTWVVVNDVPSKKYADLIGQPLLFSPDGSRMACVAVTPQRDKSFVVVDGKEWPPVHLVARSNSLHFSPDSKRLAFVCGEGELSFLMVDGTNGPSYQVLGAPKFSPDGQRLAYVATPRTGKHMLVVDGKAGAEYDSISDPVFSPDSKHVACVCGRDGKRMVVVDGKEQRAYPEIGSFPSFSLATPGTPGERRNESGAGPWFSPDGKRLVYFAGTPGNLRLVEEKWEGDKLQLVAEKSESDEWDDVGPPTFSPDSRHVAFCAGRGERQFVVYDGIVREFKGKLVSIGAEFSPDSQRFAHILVREKDRMCVVVDGVAGPDYEHIGTDADGRNLHFSLDSQHLAYIAERNNKWCVVRDGVEGKPYYEIAVVRFSPNSRHLAYQANTGVRRKLVIDGIEADMKSTDRITAGLAWGNANTLYTAVQRGRSVFRLEVTIR